MAERVVPFAAGQVWSLKAPAPAAMRVRIGAVQDVAGKVGVHVELAHAPIPGGFEADGGGSAITIGHVPMAAAALADAVDTLESEGAAPSEPFTAGYTAWREAWDQGQARFFGQSPIEVVGLIFEAYKRAKG